MGRIGRSIVFVVGTLALAAPFARAQTTEAILADSLQITPRYRFSPVFANRITGDVSSVGMFNELRTGIKTPFGSALDFLLSAEEKHYRLQDRQEENKRLSASLLHTFGPGFNGNMAVNNSRLFNRSIAPGGSIQDFVVNDLGLSTGANYRKELRDFRYDWAATTAANRGERTFKTDQTLAGGANGGVAYNLLGDRLVVQGRTALRGTDEQSRTTLQEFKGLGSTEDSLAAVVRVALADSINFRADYSNYHGERDFADQAQGSLGGQLGGVENVFREKETRDTRATTLTLDSWITSTMFFKLTAIHEEQVFDYAIQKARFSRTVGDGVNGSLKYTLPWKTVASVSFENRESLRDLGPQSVSSLEEVRKQVRVGLQHTFSKTFSMDLNGSTQLLQTFYLQYDENPRDRDQVDTSVNIRLNSQPFKPIAANINVAYSASEFINIDATQSSNNRTRELYEFRPGFTYTMNERFSITQTYGLAIEYTDYAFKQSDNFLDRNITLTNVFDFKPTTHVDFRFEYGLLLHDAGSYLPDPVTGQELLDVNTEDRRDRVVLRVNYAMNKHLAIFAENQYNQREDQNVATGRETVTTDGSIQVGTTGDYDWGSGRKLRFLLARMQRFSPFGSEAEKNYWDMRSEFNYPF